ncbi:MAG: glycosyltransferase [Candidatus Hydrogenedentes bacterium]|nr:glycosyltransferase [Candidatus Hydrogenedentota bacterium]
MASDTLTAQAPVDLSVIIPAMNEAPNLFRLLPALREILDHLGMRWEVLVVDPESPDGTAKVVEQAGARYVIDEGRGYGAAIMKGAAQARGTYVLTMDADQSHPAEFIRSLWERRNSADIVIASRYVHGGHADQPWFRHVLSRILNKFFAVGLSIPVRDLSSGFRLYRRKVLERMHPDFQNFVILVEILLRAFANGMHIQEIPFDYQPRRSGASKAKIIKFGWDYLRLFYRMWKIRNSIAFPDYDWRAYDSRIPLQRYWQRRRHLIIMRLTPSFVHTADIGCGSSRIMADLPHAVGVDFRFDKLAFMRKTNQRLVQSDGLRLPFRDGEFECVICSQVIEHVPEENGRLLNELTRILKPGGTLVLGTPDYGRWEWICTEWLYGKVAPGAYADEHVTHYTFDSLCTALASRDYELLEHHYICHGELILAAKKRGSGK